MNPVSHEQFEADQKAIREDLEKRDRPYFLWEGGVQSHYASTAHEDLLDVKGSYVLDKFFFAYGLAEERRFTRTLNSVGYPKRPQREWFA